MKFRLSGKLLSVAAFEIAYGTAACCQIQFLMPRMSDVTDGLLDSVLLLLR